MEKALTNKPLTKAGISNTTLVDEAKTNRPISERVKVKTSLPDTFIGYYGHQRRRPGDVFTIASQEHFSKRWMERVKPKKDREDDE